MTVTFRPRSAWPGVPTRPAAQRRSPFSATWSSTLDLLRAELAALDARRAVVELDLAEADLRLDGWPRANAQPATPGVILSFESRHGPLRYSCDRFVSWQENLRAVALGLESLRRVERYGIARSGEQYQGWKALPPGNGSASPDEARRILVAFLESRGDTVASKMSDRDLRRRALRTAHPDAGGDPDKFRVVQAAAEALE